MIPEIAVPSELFKMLQVLAPADPPVDVKVLVVAVPYVAEIAAAPESVCGEFTSAEAEVAEAVPVPIEFIALIATV